MTYFFHLQINNVAIGKVKTHILRRISFSKMGHRKVWEVLVGSIVHGTVRLCWIENIFESESNVPHMVHRWRSELLQ